MSTPDITIFVRHVSGCKYAGDDFARRCACRKHLRWTGEDGKRRRIPAKTRSWADAEKAKRQVEDQLSGKTADVPAASGKALTDATQLFITDKQVQGVTPGVIKKYRLELARLTSYCEQAGVFTVQGVTRDILTGYCGTWDALYPSSCTRSKVRERCRSFLRYCYEAQWLERIPALPKIKVDEVPTMPLTAEEYARLLDALHVANPRRWDGKLSTQGLTGSTLHRIHALFQLMRWSGLAIRDAVTLERAEVQLDGGLYRIVTSRQKTGTHVSVPIPTDVARELLAVPNDNERYIFWTGEGTGETIAKTWANRYVRPIFEAAGIPSTGHMLSHRLRDTFAVDLLQKGVPMEEVSKLLGHTSIRTTERHYAKWVKARQERLDRLVIGTWATQPPVTKERPTIN